MTTRISFNVNVHTLGDRAYFLEVIKGMQPTSLLLMGWDRALIDQVHGVSPDTKIVCRFPDVNEHGEWGYGLDNIKGRVSAWKAQGWLDCWHYVLNEPAYAPDELPQVLQYLQQFMDEAGYAGVKCVVGNWGPGRIEPADVNNGVYDGYLRALSFWGDQGMHLSGTHEYGGPILPGATWTPEMYLEPDKAHWWPTVAANQLPIQRVNGQLPGYWNILRTSWLNIRAAEAGANSPHHIVTEFGHDRLMNLESAHYGDGRNLNVYHELEARHGVPAPYGILRGPLSYANYWQAVFPDWSLEQCLFEQFKWADENYPPEYEGMQIFSWSYDHDWAGHGFNIAELPKLHELWMEQSQSTPAPLPAPTPPPIVVIPPVPTPAPTPPPVVTSPPVVLTPTPLPIPTGFPVIAFPVPTGNIGSITPGMFCHAAAMFYGALAESMGVTL